MSYYRIQTYSPIGESETTLSRKGGVIRIRGPRGTLEITLEDQAGADMALLRLIPTPGGGDGPGMNLPAICLDTDALPTSTSTSHKAPKS